MLVLEVKSSGWNNPSSGPNFDLDQLRLTRLHGEPLQAQSCTPRSFLGCVTMSYNILVNTTKKPHLSSILFNDRCSSSRKSFRWSELRR